MDDRPAPARRVSHARTRIMRSLRVRASGVSALARELGISKSVVHRHLGRLVEAGRILRFESEGHILYTPAPTLTARHV